MVQVYCAYDEMVPIEKVIGNPRNPNKHPETQIDLLAKIITGNGWRQPITVSKRSGFVVKGHGRLAAAGKIGMEAVPVDFQEYESEAAEWADMIADNRIAELADMNGEMLKDLLQELDNGSFDMDLTGFDEAELEKLMTQFKEDDIVEDEFDAEAEAAKITNPVSKPGNVWQLGSHRLMCGDSTDPKCVDKLMRDNYADLVFTDPPYNVDYVGKTKDALKIKNDKMDDGQFKQFLLDVYKNMIEHTKEGAGIYVCHADSEGLNFRSAMIEAGWLHKQCIIWVKQVFVMGRQDYHWRHEPILYGWKPGAAHQWYGDRKQDTVWEIDRPMRSKEHPTMKPLALCAKAISNSTKGKDIIMDLFGGSGSTLLAAEQTGRICYTMELDPVYCDVIIKRWEEFTTKTALLVEE